MEKLSLVTHTLLLHRKIQCFIFCCCFGISIQTVSLNFGNIQDGPKAKLDFMNLGDIIQNDEELILSVDTTYTNGMFIFLFAFFEHVLGLLMHF